MYKQICKIILLILCYNNLYSFTCDDITDKIKEIKDNQNLVLIIKYANTNIIIFEGLVTYAYIGNINAFVNYIKCDSQNNILYFENINNTNSKYSFSLNLDVEEVELNNNTNSEYSFPLNSDVEEVELKETFNTDRFLRFETMNQGNLDYNNLDKIKLDYINDLFSNPKNKSYDIEPIIEDSEHHEGSSSDDDTSSVEDSEHHEEPHRGRKRSRSNEEPVERLVVRLPRVKNDVCSGACGSTAGSVQDSIDRNTSSSDDDTSSVEDSEHYEEPHRGRKRSRSNEEPVERLVVRLPRVKNDVCSGACGPTAGSVQDSIDRNTSSSDDDTSSVEDSEHYEEPHRGRKRSRSNEEPVERLVVRLPRVKNDVCSGACGPTAGSVQDSIDRNTSSSDDDTSSVEDSEHHEEPHRGRKRSRSNEEPVERLVVRLPRVKNDVCSGACGSTAGGVQDNSLTHSNGDYLFGKEKLLPEVQKFIERKNLFKDKYYVLEKIENTPERSSSPQNRTVNLNFVLKNLQEGQSIVLLNCDVATQMIRFSNNIPSIIIITKINSSSYNLQDIHSSQGGFNDLYNFQGNILFGYKNSNNRGRYSLLIKSTSSKNLRLVENFYVIGELSIKKPAYSMLGTLDDNHHTSTQKIFNSMDELIRNIFKGHNYIYDKVYEGDIEKRVDYLNKNFAHSLTKDKIIVLVNDEYFSNSIPTSKTNAYSTPGIVLEQKKIDRHSKPIFKMLLIETGYYQSQFIIEDFETGFISFFQRDGKIIMRIHSEGKKTNKDKFISNYVLFSAWSGM